MSTDSEQEIQLSSNQPQLLSPPVLILTTTPVLISNFLLTPGQQISEIHDVQLFRNTPLCASQALNRVVLMKHLWMSITIKLNRRRRRQQL